MNDQQRAEIIAAFEKLDTDFVLNLRALRDAVFGPDLLEGGGDNPPAEMKLPAGAKGIDVSHYQGAIDWAKVKAAGIQFTFIKASEGTGWIDDHFKRNWANSKAAGIPRGAYHFYRFSYDPVKQADHFLEQLGSDLGELSPVVDAEDTTTTTVKGDDLRVFCERVFEKTGRRCLVYTGGWWWTAQRLGGPQPWVKDYPLWIAFYSDTAKQPSIPKDWATWAFWQHSNHGAVDGISGSVDLNVRGATSD